MALLVTVWTDLKRIVLIFNTCMVSGPAEAFVTQSGTSLLTFC